MKIDIQNMIWEIRANKTINKILNFLHYTGLRMKAMSGCKTFRVNNSTICTNNNIITKGGEYQYREGSFVERAIIENISFKDFFMTLDIFLIDEDRRVTCETRFINIGYHGMWRIWDAGTYDIEKSRQHRNRPIDRSFLADIETIVLD